MPKIEVEQVQISEEENQIRTRGWMFDALMQCGQKLAEVNHLEEKICALKSRLKEEADPEKGYKMVDKLANMRLLVKNISDDRRELMNYVMGKAFESEEEENKDEERCLLKHALLDYTIACETYEVDTDNEFFETNMEHTSETLAGIISLSLGFEFKTCMRCLADKFTKK